MPHPNAIERFRRRDRRAHDGVAEASYRDEIRKAAEPLRRRRLCKGIASSGQACEGGAGGVAGVRNQRAGANRDCIGGAISPIRPALGMSAFCAQPTAGVDVLEVKI
jgi:hypothetical protein